MDNDRVTSEQLETSIEENREVKSRSDELLREKDRVDLDSVKEDTEQSKKKSKSLENALTELRRAKNAYRKQVDDYNKEQKQTYNQTVKNLQELQKNVGNSAEKIFDVADNYMAKSAEEVNRRMVKRLSDSFNRDLVDIQKRLDVSVRPTGLSKIIESFKDSRENTHYGIIQRGTGGFVDNVLEKKRQESDFIKARRMVDKDQGKTDAEYKQQFRQSLEIQKDLAKKIKDLGFIKKTLGASNANDYIEKEILPIYKKLREIDSRFVSENDANESRHLNLERQDKVDQLPDEDQFAAFEDRLKKAHDRVEKNQPQYALIEPKKSKEESGGIQKLNSDVESEKKERVIDGLLDVNKKQLSAQEKIAEILSAVYKTSNVKKTQLSDKKDASLVHGIALSSSTLTTLAKSIGSGSLNFIKGIFGAGKGMSSVLGRVAGTAGAAFTMYDDVKNFDKETKNPNGTRRGFFQRGTDGSILDSRAGMYAKNSVSGAILGAQLGSFIPGVGNVVGAGVGALGGLAVTAFQDYKPEIIAGVHKFADSVVSITHNVESTFSSVWQKTKTFVAPIAASVEETSKNMFDMMLHPFDSSYQIMAAMFPNVTKTVTTMVNKLKNLIPEPIKHLLDTIENIIMFVPNMLKKMIGDGLDKLGSIGKSLYNDIFPSEPKEKKPVQKPVSAKEEHRVVDVTTKPDVVSRTIKVPTMTPKEIEKQKQQSSTQQNQETHHNTLVNNVSNVVNNRSMVYGAYSLRNTDMTLNRMNSTRDLAFAI